MWTFKANLSGWLHSLHMPSTFHLLSCRTRLHDITHRWLQLDLSRVRLLVHCHNVASLWVPTTLQGPGTGASVLCSMGYARPHGSLKLWAFWRLCKTPYLLQSKHWSFHRSIFLEPSGITTLPFCHNFSYGLFQIFALLRVAVVPHPLQDTDGVNPSRLYELCRAANAYVAAFFQPEGCPNSFSELYWYGQFPTWLKGRLAESRCYSPFICRQKSGRSLTWPHLKTHYFKVGIGSSLPGGSHFLVSIIWTRRDMVS